MAEGASRRARLQDARLYLCTPSRPDLAEFLDAVLSGGVDVFQLRDKRADEATLRHHAATARALCDAAGATFILNDRPDLVEAVDADGVHVGQDDVPVPEARAAVGAERIVGLSTHSEAQADAAAGVDYIAVGPCHATPTKAGRRAIWLDPVRHAAATVTVPWFAIGGIDEHTIDPVLDAGARHVVVVRAIAEADDPGAAARRLRDRLEAAGGPAES